jgi:hypothetical protein
LLGDFSFRKYQALLSLILSFERSYGTQVIESRPATVELPPKSSIRVPFANGHTALPARPEMNFEAHSSSPSDGLKPMTHPAIPNSRVVVEFLTALPARE